MKFAARSLRLMAAVAGIACLSVTVAMAAHWWGYYTTGLTGPAIGGIKPGGESEFASIIASPSKKSIVLEVEMGSINLPDGTVLSIKINSTTVGQASLRAKGVFINLSTDRGAKLPEPKKGDVITVVQSSGKVILTGTFK